MADKRYFSDSVQRFCESAHEHEYGLVTAKVDELCKELRSCTGEISERSLGIWERRLGAVEGAYRACDEAGGVQGLCNPFFEKAGGLIEACRRL